MRTKHCGRRATSLASRRACERAGRRSSANWESPPGSASWTLAAATGPRRFRRLSASYSPPPPEGFISPVTWGVEENVIERFTATGVPQERISFQKDTYTFSFAGSPSELLGEFRTYYGPTMNAFEAASADGREAELQAELEDLFNEQNTIDTATSIPATFLRVTVQR